MHFLGYRLLWIIQLINSAYPEVYNEACLPINAELSVTPHLVSPRNYIESPEGEKRSQSIRVLTHGSFFPASLIRSLAKALGGSTTSLTSGGAGGGVGGVGGGGGGSSSDDAARSKLTKGYFKELLSAHFRQPELKV